MNKSLGLLLLTLAVLLSSFKVAAQQYNLSDGQYPPCNTTWQVNENIYTCSENGKVTLSSGDIIIANAESTLVANGFELRGNVIGSQANNINLEANNDITVSDSEIVGSLTAIGNITVTSATVSGNITTPNNHITVSDSDIVGSLTAIGNITVTKATVSGNITTPNNNITVSDSDIVGSLTANRDINVTNSELKGDVRTSNSGINITETNVVGDLSANADIITDKSFITGNITSTHNQVTLNNQSYILGNVTAGQPDWGTVNVNGGSTVTGVCQYKTVPDNACGITPALKCFNDDFNHSDLTQNWVTFKSSGDFPPSIVNNRLRLTQAVEDQATAATFQRIFPAKDNLVRVEFDYFAYDGTGADGVAIVFSDAAVTPQVGAFGGPLGYGYRVAEKKPGFAGGWLGIGLDEFGNYSVEGGGNSLDSRRRQSVVLRGSGAGYSGYNYLTGTCYNGTVNTNGNCLSTAIDGNNGNPLHRYRITIDSRQSDTLVVTVSRRVGINGNWEDLIGPIDVMTFQVQQNVPDELFMSITGSTGTETNIHEIDEFKVCALNSRPVGEQINHFRITLPQQALTCDVADVSIRACANGDCSTSFTEPVTANLKPNSLPGATGGWVNGSTLSFNNGIGQAQLRRNQAGPVEVGVLGSNPTAVAFNNTKCSYNGSDFSEANCVVEFVDSGFVLDVPHAYANQLVTGTITALSKGDNPELCIPSFAGVDKDVSLWSEYLTPSGGQGFSAMNVVVDDLPISNNSAAPSHRSLYFDENGQAKFELTYHEAGSLALHARFNGSGDEQDLLLEGQANFIRVPRALVLSANHTYDPKHSDGKCPTANLGCLVFARAGEGFNLNIKAVAAEPNEDNDFTNNLGVINYQQPSIILNHTLVEPSNGSDGSIGTLNYDHELGEVTTVQQSVSEVGVFDFSLVPPTSYLGLDLFEADLPIAFASTGPIGRFIPAYFDVSPMPVTLTAACSTGGQSFTYLGQPFGYANNPGLYLQPKSGSGSDTLNYLIGDWWRYNNDWGNRDYHANHANHANGINISLDTTSNPAPTVVRVQSDSSAIALNNEVMVYDKPATPINPFTARFKLVLHKNDLKDSDGVCFKTADSDQESDCQGISFDDVDGSMTLYWGRLTIEDVDGPETQGLQQKIIREYYTSDGFVTNTHDNCTELTQLNVFEFQSNDFSVNQDGSKPPVTVTMQPDTSPLTLEQGMKRLDYTAPGVSNRGVIKALLNLEQHGLPWLRRYNAQSETWDDSAAGLVQFGIYSGSNRVIWSRELN